MGVISGGRLVAKALKKEGVRQIFTVSGGHIMDIYFGCREEGIRVIDTRSEATATYAAEAYTKVTGIPGVVVTTAGPGVTNTTSGMVEARVSGVPIIHIGGAARISGLDSGQDQDINSVEIMAAVSKWARKIYETRRIPEYVSMAFRQALAPRQAPVYLEAGVDVLYGEVDEGEVVYPENYRAGAPSFGDPALIVEAADLLLSARRPVMMIGNDARFSEQFGEAIAELADYLQIPVAVLSMAQGVFANEELNPLFRLRGAQKAADVVLMLGVENDVSINRCRPPAFAEGVKLIQVNSDATRVGYNAAAAVGIVGGAGAVASQILDVIKSKTSKRTNSNWVQEATKLVQETNKPYSDGFTSDAMPMNPGRCAFEVSKFLNSEGMDWNVVMDGGDAALWIRAAATARRPGQLLTMGINGTIGMGAGYTLGAWAANEKPVLYYTGDGSFGFHAMEFDTFCRFGIPVVCVISNDSAWGMIKHATRIYHPEKVANGNVGVELTHMRAYEKLAAMWDGYGEKVTRPEEVVPAIMRGAATGLPSIINVEVDQVTASPVMRGLVGWE
jgi:acetolactate synthase-1/2/3 large subunit